MHSADRRCCNTNSSWRCSSSRKRNSSIRSCRCHRGHSGYLLWKHRWHWQHGSKRHKGWPVSGKRGCILSDRKCLCICGIRNDSNRTGIHSGKSDIQKHSNNSRQRRHLNGSRSRCAEDNHRCDRKWYSRNGCRYGCEWSDSKGAEWNWSRGEQAGESPKRDWWSNRGSRKFSGRCWESCWEW